MRKFLSLAILFFLIQPAYAFYDRQAETNKENAIEFCNAVMNEKNFDAATKYIGNQYIQHSPSVEDGTQGLKKRMDLFRTLYPYSHIEIKRVAADGDYVFLHLHAIMVPNTKGFAVVDIFRFENNKIVEHWDAIQEVPNKSANNNGMF